MDRKCSFTIQFIHAVYGISYDIHDSSADLRTDRHRYRGACSLSFHSASETVSTVHCDCPDGVLTDMLLHFNDKPATIRTGNCKSLMDSGECSNIISIDIKMHIDYRADYL